MPNLEALQSFYQTYKDSLVEHLNASQAKVFDVPVGDKIYQLSYRIENGEILLFSHNSEGFDDRDMVLPRLRLNVGTHYLPDALNLDGTPVEMPSVAPTMGVTMVEGSGREGEELMAEIKKKGFLKIIGLK